VESERRDKILRLVEENLAKDGRVFRLVIGSDEAADGLDPGEQVGGTEIEGIFVQKDC